MAETYQGGDVCEFEARKVFLVLDRRLGTGAFGEVWKCQDRKTGATRALKIVRSQDQEAARDEVRKHERAVRKAMPSHVPELYFYETGKLVSGSKAPSFEAAPRLLGIVMEFIDGRTLHSLISRTGPLRQCYAVTVMNDVLTALGRLHMHGIIHCDVKSDNVLISRSGECYLCDFGVSVFLEDYADNRPMPCAGTPSHMAPEMWRTEPTRYDTKYDVWSAGILGFEMVVGRTPWHYEDGYLHPPELIFSLLRQIEEIDLEEVPYRGPYLFFLEHALEIDPEDRATVQDIFQEPMFTRLHPEEREELGKL